MMPNMDRLAEDWYRKWDPEYYDDEEDEEETEDADYFDIDPFDGDK